MGGDSPEKKKENISKSIRHNHLAEAAGRDDRGVDEPKIF